jgi:methanethiol S-methyltransferase
VSSCNYVFRSNVQKTAFNFEVALAHGTAHSLLVAPSSGQREEIIVLGFIFSVASYLGFLAVFTYFACFSDGIFVPKTVDTGWSSGEGSAFAVNLGLVLLFGLQHSIMARPGFKRMLTRLVPERLERATYVFASSAALALLIWQWQPMNTVLWSVDNPVAAAVMWAFNALGWLGVPLSSLMIDHFHLFGLKQAFDGFRRRSFEQTGFVTPLFYKYVRHPMMTALLLGLWLTPHMTIGHLLLSVGMSVYIMVGVHFEERALSRELGLDYVRYQASTPRFIPLGRRTRAVNDDQRQLSRSSSRATE